MTTVQIGAFTGDTKQKLLAADFVDLPASTAIDPRTAQRYLISKAGVAALTLAAPTAGVDDGIAIYIGSRTANAHTVTTSGLLQTGSASVNTATFAAFAGAGLRLVAFNGFWIVEHQVGITFS